MIESLSGYEKFKNIVFINGATGGTYATSISGSPYWYDADEIEIPITAAVQSDVDEITLTLDSAVAGTLYYIYGADLTIDRTKVVKDNATISMPLRTYTGAVA